MELPKPFLYKLVSGKQPMLSRGREMQNPRVQNRLQEILDLFRELSGANRLQVHWGRYLCIMIASFLENAAQAIYEDYTDSTAGGHVAQYVSNQIAFTVGNANADSMVRTAKAFSETWASELRSFLAEDDRQSAINTIVGQRNLIAHGEQSSISPAQLRSHLGKAVEVIDFIEHQCLEQPRTNTRC